VNIWRWIVSWLVWLSADPAAIDLEAPRAAAAVAAARASMATGAPTPPPAPSDCVCGGTCKNGVWKPDGRIEQRCPCPASCKCKAKACPDGRCRDARKNVLP
jgi:hypothetical protein